MNTVSEEEMKDGMGKLRNFCFPSESPLKGYSQFWLQHFSEMYINSYVVKPRWT